MSLSWWGYLGLIICCYRTFEIQSRCSMYTLASCWAEWPLGERSRESLLCRPDPVDAARRVAWVRCSARGQGVRRVWVASAFVSYGAKRLVLIVLLFGMLLALSQNTWVGGQGFALGIGNYLAIVCSSLSILLAVLSHIGALGPTESAVEGARRHRARRRSEPTPTATTRSLSLRRPTRRIARERAEPTDLPVGPSRTLEAPPHPPLWHASRLLASSRSRRPLGGTD